MTPRCEVCDRRADPCPGRTKTCQSGKCDHRGPLRTFRRDVTAHVGCVPKAWEPLPERRTA